jgi:hypothetical protein
MVRKRKTGLPYFYYKKAKFFFYFFGPEWVACSMVNAGNSKNLLAKHLNGVKSEKNCLNLLLASYVLFPLNMGAPFHSD